MWAADDRSAHGQQPSRGARADPLDDVRNIEITYSRLRPGAGTCFVEHTGGRVEVFEVDRFLLERLLEYLARREARSFDGPQ